ncbi:MAG TPA: hypothetical protein VEN29_14290 [Casimicrobiaceae bacterium]|nr:hypothetical protein [Casimicrobiaceae bacterium]
MNVRTLLAVALAASAISASAQEPAPVVMPAVPAHNCVKPDLPGANATQSTMRKFNDTYKTYGECIKKYIDGAKALADAAMTAGNNAVNEYNKLTDQIKAYNDAAKN